MSATPDPGSARAVRLLLVEDQKTDAELEVRELKRAGLRVEFRLVDRQDDFLEALEQAAVDLGLRPADARKLAYATFAGSVALARQSADPPATLRANVTSKGGTTARALDLLVAAQVDRHFIAAVKAAAARARELGDEIANAR